MRCILLVPTIPRRLFWLFTSLDDLIDEAELNHIHDEWEYRHDKDDLNRGRKVLDHAVSHFQEQCGYAGESEREEDHEFHYQHGDEVGHELSPPTEALVISESEYPVPTSSFEADGHTLRSRTLLSRGRR